MTLGYERSLRNDPSTQENDLAVITATSAGFSAAITGAEEVAQVALIGSGAISNFEPPGAQED